MRVAFLTPWDVEDPYAWSGIVKPAFDSLSVRADVVAVRAAPHHCLLDRALTRLHGELRLGGYLPSFGVTSARATTLDAIESLNRVRPDIILAFGSSDALYARTMPAPVVQLCEATFTALLDYYPTHTGLSRLSRIQGHRVERASAAATSGFLATSQWAADRLGKDCAVPGSRVLVAPLGPGIDASQLPPAPEGDDAAEAGGPRVLAVARDWERKDGDRVLRVAHRLRELVPTTRLTVVGRELDTDSWITSHARLSREDLARAYRDHDLLFEFTRANTGGVVLADAASASLPVVANATGAVPSLVRDGVTGLLVAPEASDTQVAQKVADLLGSGRLAEMRRQSRSLYESAYNWQTWADDALAFLERHQR